MGEERAEAGANVFNFSFTIRQHHMEQNGAYRGKRDGCHFYSFSFLSEDKKSEFSAGSLSLARKVVFMIAKAGEDILFNQLCGLFGLFGWFFCFVLHRISRIGLHLSNIFIMSVHYFLAAFRCMLGTFHNQILFIWRLSWMPRHLNASKRNAAALSDCAVALLLPAVPHNLGLPADLW